MRVIESLGRRIRSLFGKEERNAELSEEIAFHLEREMAQKIADGMSAENARRAARASFGSVPGIAEECYRARGTAWIEDFWQDVRYGLRTMVKHRMFSVVTVLTLALGIGSCTAVFSLMDAVLLRSLPYGNPEQLFYLYTPSMTLLREKVPAKFFNPSYADFEDLKKQNRSLSAMTMFNTTSFNFSERDQLERLGAATVDVDFFKTLQSRPEIGRAFDANDEKPGNEHVVVISHALWISVFDGKRNVLGQRVRLDGTGYQIIGVMPAGFEYPHSSDLPSEFAVPNRTQLWVPSAITPQQVTACREGMKGGCAAFAVGRLKSGVKVNQAQTELSTMMSRLDPLHNNPMMLNDFTASLASLRDFALGPVRPLMFLLLGAVGVVLLIACANAANLLLARAANRTQELGVRATLGAKRGRLLRQMLAESLMLAGAAGCAGAALAWIFLHLLLQLNPGDIPRLEDAGSDYRVLGFLIAVTMLTSLLFGILPSMMATRINLVEFLKSGTRGFGGDKRWARKTLAVSQIALVVTLLIGSGLLLKSYANVLAVQTGIAPSTVTASVELSPSAAAISASPRYGTPEKRRVFFRDLVEGVRNSPGVEVAGLIDLLPLGHAEMASSLVAQGHPEIKDQLVEVRSVTPEYFSAMGIAQLRGSDFTDGDGPGGPDVVIVNEALAKKYFGSIDVVGQHVSGTAKGPWSTIVGVVGDVRNGGPEADVIPQAYGSLWQGDTVRGPEKGVHLAVRSELPEDAVVMEMRAVMKRLDPNLAIADIHTMKEMETMATARRRFQTALLSVFSAISMLMALVGVYGLLAFSVRQRTGEIGVRMALGATRAGVAMLVLREGMILLAAGLVIGLSASVAFTRLLKSFLFGVPAIDPVTYGLVPLVMLLGVVAASLIPSMRAASVEPMSALRHE